MYLTRVTQLIFITQCAHVNLVCKWTDYGRRPCAFMFILKLRKNVKSYEVILRVFMIYMLCKNCMIVNITGKEVSLHWCLNCAECVLYSYFHTPF